MSNGLGIVRNSLFTLAIFGLHTLYVGPILRFYTAWPPKVTLAALNRYKYEYNKLAVNNNSDFYNSRLFGRSSLCLPDQSESQVREMTWTWTAMTCSVKKRLEIVPIESF